MNNVQKYQKRSVEQFKKALAKADTECANRGYKITSVYKFADGRYDSIWHGGECLRIENDLITITVNAYGDVIGTLTTDNDALYVKDKSNSGWFENEFGQDIINDQDYYNKLNDETLVLDNNNWWEAKILRKKDNAWIDNDAGLLDQSTIVEVLETINEILDWSEECYEEN